MRPGAPFIDFLGPYPASAEMARKLGATSYFTGKPCKHGHISIRRTKGSQCYECCREENERKSAALKQKPKKLKGPDHSGSRFGLWTVHERVESNGRGNARWLCVCDCGTRKVVPANSLVNGKSKSCGCMSQTWRTSNLTKHGQSRAGNGGSPTGAYKSWHAMRQRCENEKHDQFADYGGRGITICDRWLSFTNFFADMGERPPKWTLDRIDPNGNYEPSNCRWASRKTQSQNQRPRLSHSFMSDLVGAARLVVAANDNTPIAEVKALKKALEAYEERMAA